MGAVKRISGDYTIQSINSGNVVINAGNVSISSLTAVQSATTFGLKTVSQAGTTMINSGAPLAVQPIYMSSGQVQYFTGNSTTNWVPNFEFSVSAPLNSSMNVGDTVNVQINITNGSVAHFSNTAQVDGSSCTVRWNGGTAPTSGVINGVDVYSYTIIKTGNAAWSIFGSALNYK